MTLIRIKTHCKNFHIEGKKLFWTLFFSSCCLISSSCPLSLSKLTRIRFLSPSFQQDSLFCYHWPPHCQIQSPVFHLLPTWPVSNVWENWSLLPHCLLASEMPQSPSTSVTSHSFLVSLAGSSSSSLLNERLMAVLSVYTHSLGDVSNSITSNTIYPISTPKFTYPAQTSPWIPSWYNHHLHDFSCCIYSRDLKLKHS